MPKMIPLPYRISLLALQLAVTLPFLGAHHLLPIPTFHQEWLAGMLGLAALLPQALIRSEATPLSVPRSALLPLALVAVAGMQLAAGLHIDFENLVLFSLYLVWAFCLMLAACRLESAFGRDRLADALAAALFAGALLLAATGAVQRWLPAIGMPYIFPSTGITHGNIAQANNFADYLWLGVACGLFLACRHRRAAAPLIAGVLCLIGMSLLSGSRSVYFYAAALTGWLLLWQWLRPSADRRRLAAALLLIPALFAVQWLIDLGGTTVASAQRLAAQGSYDPVRLTLWRAAWDIFSEHPLLGAGLDSFPREFFARIAAYPINGVGIPEHSHNLLTELLVETGLAGASLLLASASLWLLAWRRWRYDAASVLALGLLLVLGIHSGLEYPLWYAHFLAIAAVMLALGDGRRWQVAFAPRHRLLLAAVTLCGGIVLVSLRSDYVQLEEAAQGRMPDGTLMAKETQTARLLDIYGHSLWRNYAALQFAAVMPISDTDAAERLQMVEEAMHFSPIRRGVFRAAALLAVTGQQEAARAQLQRAMLSYPGEIPAAATMFADAAEASPGIRAALAPLREMLRQRSF